MVPSSYQQRSPDARLQIRSSGREHVLGKSPCHLLSLAEMPKKMDDQKKGGPGGGDQKKGDDSKKGGDMKKQGP